MLRKLPRSVFAVALVAALAGVTGLHAQESKGAGLQVDLGASVLTGEDFESQGTGLALTALGSYAWTSGWELGVAAGFASHDPDLQLNSVSAVARKRFYVPSASTPHVHPFLEARAGWVQLNPDVGAAASGIQVGGGGGAEWWISSAVGLVGGVNLSYLSVDGASGLHFLPRAGFKVRFGGS